MSEVLGSLFPEVQARKVASSMKSVLDEAFNAAAEVVAAGQGAKSIWPHVAGFVMGGNAMALRALQRVEHIRLVAREANPDDIHRLAGHSTMSIASFWVASSWLKSPGADDDDLEEFGRNVFAATLSVFPKNLGLEEEVEDYLGLVYQLEENIGGARLDPPTIWPFTDVVAILLVDKLRGALRGSRLVDWDHTNLPASELEDLASGDGSEQIGVVLEEWHTMLETWSESIQTAFELSTGITDF
jgi:hypothetical protein